MYVECLEQGHPQTLHFGGPRGGGEYLLMGTRFPLGATKIFWNRQRWRLPHTECAKSCWIVHSKVVSFTLGNSLLKKEEKSGEEKFSLGVLVSQILGGLGWPALPFPAPCLDLVGDGSLLGWGRRCVSLQQFHRHRLPGGV